MPGGRKERELDGWVLVDGCVHGWMDGRIDEWKETRGREVGCGLEDGDLEAGSWVPRLR